MCLSPAQRDRYARHLTLPEVGEAGQRVLLSSRVAIVGAGGLGSPAALYLAAAGVGTLGLVDADVVAASNLQRQILHCTPDVGKPKVESGAARLRQLNPDVTVRVYAERLTAANALSILGDYAFVVDATDNFASKFLIADACHFSRTPYAHGGITAFRGQLLTVLPGVSACYRCVFGEPPPDDARGAAPAGPLGAVPGVIGALQALEAIKCLLGKGALLTNRLLAWDALTMRFRETAVRRNPQCPLCGTHPRITSLA